MTVKYIKDPKVNLVLAYIKIFKTKVNEYIHFFSGFYFLLKFVNRNEKSKQFHYFVRIVSVKMGMHFYLKKKT